MNLPEFLKHTKLFSSLEDEARETIARLAVQRSYPAGQTLFRQDENAEGFYLVLEGKVKVYKLSADGRQQILHVFGPGQAFAEAAMFAGGTYPAFGETVSETTVAFFPRDAFVRELANDPNLALAMISSLAQLCHQLAGMVEQLALSDVAGRVARYLAELARQRNVPLERGEEIALDLPKGELARYVGTAPETLSRALGRLVQQDLVAVDGRRITFRNAEGLRALAAGTPPSGDEDD